MSFTGNYFYHKAKNAKLFVDCLKRKIENHEVQIDIEVEAEHPIKCKTTVKRMSGELAWYECIIDDC